ncbi:hypothetical protein AUJ66_02115 [Candidatus Desantisbacteria bacterium CG1_02_38_46]|uniref:Uncharacterized protein n=3 Tax=unclassified Candidatus Desantisiibacteriota TaxID=3106372 RepID=A0A2H9PBM1_9BACT|nr:MAG: hypothetical protein AUJ66_02115 [Candidatus Desantisbacteria bacterium CG1_02_38_46]PIU51195.1 MAG: hypothetical protein COS91_05820 [Candidatus Desantisbacteria bacterium CG07_land_8_20_14_0_80_39_15]PIZ16246.1 MAG: hypothetical protein COY51_03220 [Candidatus Desantisbacteria bacterium CG_4_10_14_0_8_um_filter_39_17]
MRIIGDFDKYKALNKKKFTAVRERLLANRMKKKGCKSKDPDELKILRILILARMERWQKEGKLKILGPREYRLSLF